MSVTVETMVHQAIEPQVYTTSDFSSIESLLGSDEKENAIEPRKILFSAQVQRVRTNRSRASERSKPKIDIECIKREYQPYLEEIQSRRVCVVCNAVYSGVTNMLGWHCSTHPGDFNHVTRIYNCCGKSEGESGCVPCMHASSKERAEQLRFSPEKICISVPKILTNQKLVTIYRGMVVDQRNYSNIDSKMKISDMNLYLHCVDQMALNNVYSMIY